MGKIPDTTAEAVFALIAQILWSGFLGVIFSLLIPIISSKSILIKGTFYGYIVGFLIWMVPKIFKTPELESMNLGTVTSHAIEGIIFGFILALTIAWLDKKFAGNEA